ncbi:MAG: hypothetical protein M4579_005409 [Chaenotheca gracillima]|nr:MAG: hypothetical protein M4579_005409 [Chaenotheca gracillima]
MSLSGRKGPKASVAELYFGQLKNCLVNLPSSLVQVLTNSDIPAQNAIVELSFRPQAGSINGSTPASAQTSVYVGWTGMPSRRRLAPIVGREGFRGSSSGREQEVAAVEIDATFAKTLGLFENQKIGVSLHSNPPLAHTVHIEPLTSDDWEIIELHANFLELNLLSQIRALPNPSFSPPGSNSKIAPHPLTLHLSPTSTANIIVTSLSPAPPDTSPFAKISPDAEVIVAPKSRRRSSRSEGRESSSVASVGRRSAGARSGASTTRTRNRKDEIPGRGAVFFRCLDRSIGGSWFDDLDADDHGLKAWVDKDALVSRHLQGVTWVKISLVRPAGLEAPIDPQQQAQPAADDRAHPSDISKPAGRIVARILPWEDAPDSQHVALSSDLSAALSSEGLVGGIIRIEAANPSLQKSQVKSLKIFPFSKTVGKGSEGLRFGGDSKAEKALAAQKLRDIFGSTSEDKAGLLDGPLTDGMFLGKIQGAANGWEGGLLRFDPPIPTSSVDTRKTSCEWLLGSEHRLEIDVQPDTTKPTEILSSLGPGERLVDQLPVMVGVNSLIEQLLSQLSRSSSVLLTGGLGSGKTSLAQLVAQRLRKESLFYVTYFPCRKLVTDEMRVSTIKDNLNRLFMSAAWGARLGGRGIVILDDLEKLCPVETELQVGGENGRSRQISELLCSMVHEYCGPDSDVVLLATSSAKESLNNVVIGGHVVREIVSLKAPDKDRRRQIFELLANVKKTENGTIGNGINDEAEKQDGAWMEGSNQVSRPGSSSHEEGFQVDVDVDFLDLAGQTDGYMPGDLVLLVSRARSEALIRSIGLSSQDLTVSLGREDFDRALEGFTPASLRNVSLQTSTTTFAAIGGLHLTRKTLLETLQYPTTYAPIFAQCPLRLRSGLLLYGYPGCGKTMLASAVAGECGLNFISVKGPEILNKYIGASEKSVRDLFERAEAAKPCVLFFDEFDSIAPKRGHDSTGVTDRVVNQMLTQMDGAEGLSGVYVLAATSRPDLIDPALLRPGRLDKSLLCDLPSYDDRVDILRALSKKLKMAADVLGSGLFEIAKQTEGFSGADLQALVYNAQLEAIHDVLGDHHQSGTTASGRTKGKRAEKGRKTQPGGAANSSSNSDFISFLFDEAADKADRERRTQSSAGKSAWFAEQAAIVSKLDALKLARRRQRLIRREQRENSSHVSHGRPTDASNNRSVNGVEQGASEQEDSTDVVIRWEHVTASMGETRPSISAQDRTRLDAIYREFVMGRNGEMPSGQGGTEIGGRSSLM